jgi:uncharacterized protein (DUF1501 family)
MNETTRAARRALLRAGGTLAMLGASGAARAAMGPNDKYDLLVRNA